MSGKTVITKRFNVHGVVRVRVESCFPAVIQHVMHQLAEFEEALENEHVLDVLIRDYAEAPRLTDATVISDYYYYANGWLNIPHHRACFNLTGSTITVYCERLLLPVNLLVHLALLRKNHSLIHSAAVEFEGRRYLFPAFGGVGKTTLVAAVVFAGGKLFGDDMNIVNDHQVLSYPIDFSVYPYHMALLGLEDRGIARGFKRTEILSYITDVLERHDSRLAKLAGVALNSLKVPCVNIAPRRIFGDQCFAEAGVVDEVYYISRTDTNSKELAISPIAPMTLAEVSAKVLLHEWHQSMQYLYVYSGLSSFSVEHVYRSTEVVLEQLFSTRPCYSIEIPASMANDDYQRELVRHVTMPTRSVVV